MKARLPIGFTSFDSVDTPATTVTTPDGFEMLSTIGDAGVGAAAWLHRQTDSEGADDYSRQVSER